MVFTYSKLTQHIFALPSSSRPYFTSPLGLSFALNLTGPHEVLMSTIPCKKIRVFILGFLNPFFEKYVGNLLEPFLFENFSAMKVASNSSTVSELNVNCPAFQ